MDRNETRKDFGIIFWIHLLVLMAIYSSPFWLNWVVILILMTLCHFQFRVFGTCILTIMEFGNNEQQPTDRRVTSFHEYYLAKMGIRISRQKMDVILNIIVPALLILTALLWQVALKKWTLHISFL